MNIYLKVVSERIGVFYELLFTGIMIRIKTACSIRRLLCDDLGIDAAYADTRIQTIFLDGRAIDDIDAAVIRDGSVLALSGAMPGLAGAVFRKGGVFSPMRTVPAAEPEHATNPSAYGVVILKLFNQVAADLGPSFLKNGIWIFGEIFHRFWDQKADVLQKIYKEMEIDGKKRTMGEGMFINGDSGNVWLSIDAV